MREMKLQPDIYAYNLLMCVIKDCGAGDPSLTSSLLEEEAQNHKSSISVSHKKNKSLNPETIDIKEPLVAHQSQPVILPEETIMQNREEDAVAQRLENSIGKVVLPNILGKKMTAGDVIALGALDKPQDR